MKVKYQLRQETCFLICKFFKEADDDENGQLDRSEIGDCLSSLGVDYEDKQKEVERAKVNSAN